MIQDIERNYQYQLANGSGANATEQTAFGQFPNVGGNKMQKPQMTEAEMFNWYQESRYRMQEAQEFFAKHGIENYNDR
jgi:hypothetical protein